jgi:hypothetical protein
VVSETQKPRAKGIRRVQIYGAEEGEFVDPECGKTFTKLLSAMSNKINKRRPLAAGPYCSLSCAAKMSGRIRQQKHEKSRF